MEKLETQDTSLLAQWVESTYRTVKQVDGEYVVAFCHTPDRIFRFSAIQWILLHQLSTSKNLKEACQKAKMSIAQAQRFLRSKEYKEFAGHALEIEAVVRGFPAIRVLYETIRQFEGKIKLDENQNKALDRLERLLMPKKHESAPSTVNVQVNNFPTLPQDVVDKLKALGDARATETTAS